MAGGSLGLGGAGTLNVIPSSLQPVYGARTPMGATIFLRLRPGRMHMTAGRQPHDHGTMHGTKMHDANDGAH